MKKIIYTAAITLLLIGCSDDNTQKNIESPVEDNKASQVTNSTVATDEQIESVEPKKIIEEKETIEPKDTIDENEEDPLVDLFADDPVPEKGGTINVEQVKAIIEYHALGANDTLVEASLDNENINATIEVSGTDTLPAEMFAEVIFASSGEELLLHEGWEVLTINFIDIGTVSMNRAQKKDDGFGPYFPNIDIIKQLEK